ncbi:DUF7344 domain-containing protein [Halorussus sp. AFM4]|uniref:DUF7344 domain-containing protein n=1 Tax=Halorussus sp. AFM4 TaxID=3421651 RepID=UPI003EB69A74
MGDSREERVVRLLADARNREVLSVLNDADEPLHIDELASRLVKRDSCVLSTSAYEDEYDRVRIALHHNHLPKLAEEGLVEYDAGENVVAQRDHQASDPDWTDVELIDELLADLRGGDGPDEDAIGVIERRETVIEYGRQLVDEADEELFCMYVNDDVLEEECLRRVETAIARGVDAYVGSQNANVRDLVRRQLPEATLWEPQLDLMNSPSGYPRVGWLLFADREKLMLALLDESAGDEEYRMTAMIGEGATNPLVVLVRELLGPRLDHLDYQSEDFRGKLPF